MLRTLALAGCLALALGPDPQSRRPVKLEAADCSRINMTGDYEVARATLHETVPVSAGRLDIQPESNGGVQIERGSGGVYAITACISAGARTYGDAQAAADSVRLSIEGSRVRVQQPQTRDVRSWSVHLIVEVPDGAAVTAESTNGPLGATGVSATLNLRASNGPIGIRDVTGEVRARAANGPISVEGSRGQFDVETSNGPIDVRLNGRRWDGWLEARAQNGPLTVHVPADYQSGVEITSSNHSPWSCRVAACRSGYRDWDDRSRTLRLGSDRVVVRISTVNGPVTIAER